MNLINLLKKFVIVPSIIQIPAFGLSTVQLTIYPGNGFVPNSTYQITIFGVYTTPEFMPSYCSSSFEIHLEDCTADKMVLQSRETTSPTSTLFDTAITYYPNPVLHTLTVNWKENEQVDSIGVYDISGRQVILSNINHDSLEKTLSLETITSGVYLLVVKKKGAIVSQFKIIKK
jgi:hypothetical protein